MPWPAPVRRSFPWVLAGIPVAATALPFLSVVSARGVASIARTRGPLAAAITVGAGASGLGASLVGARRLRRSKVRDLRDSARCIDSGFAEPPGSAAVTTGPGSALTLAAVGREGARYLGSATTPSDIEFVTGQAPLAEPIRVFVGFDSADSIDARIALAVAELERTGAFERSTLLVQAPAGTGYANSTPVDVVECLTEGDCASVAVGYGLLPSFLSLDRVALATRTQAALLAAIASECRELRNPPRVLLYGESLGAKVQQRALPGGVADLERLGVDRALWVGTPGGKDYDDAHRLFDPVAITIDRPEQLPLAIDEHLRVWFLEHDGDPVVRFRSDLAYRRPSWLDPSGIRGRGIPEDMRWSPGITWAQVLVDTVFATDVTPGDFRSEGHDYRADLGAVATAAFALGDRGGRVPAGHPAGRCAWRNDCGTSRCAGPSGWLRVRASASRVATLEPGPSSRPFPEGSQLDSRTRPVER